MNILKVFTIMMLATLFVFNSCKKNDIPPTSPPTINNNPPGSFTIALQASSWDTAKINWTKAIDPDNDSVSYMIYLNDTLKVQNFNDLSYTFRNLNEITSYNIKVVAIDTKLKETISSISITTKKYWLKFLKKVEYGSITGYSHQRTGQMIKANDGGYIIVGNSQLGDWPYGVINMFTMKVDSLGNKIWQRRYDYNAGNISNAKIVSYNNGYIICGDENLMRIDNNGNLVWHKTITLPYELFTGIGAGSDGTIYSLGYAPNGLGSGVVIATMGKYDQFGNLIWKKTFSRTTREEFYDIKIFSDNEVIVLGRTKEPDADFWVLKLNSEGSIIWEKTYHDQEYAFPENIIRTSEGDYVFTGFSLGAYDIPYLYLQKIDANGNNKWTYQVSADKTKGYSVAETNDNSLIVTGGFQLTYGYEASLYKFDKNGNKIWGKLYGEFSTYLINKSVIPTSDGGYIINSQKSKAYNASSETDQIYIFKTDDKGEFN
ncbi:MAG: fibronectin type III domain-containing protein [Chitinophagaceae bacterium]